jgi:hypothetical protein
MTLKVERNRAWAQSQLTREQGRKRDLSTESLSHAKGEQSVSHASRSRNEVAKTSATLGVTTGAGGGHIVPNANSAAATGVQVDNSSVHTNANANNGHANAANSNSTANTANTSQGRRLRRPSFEAAINSGTGPSGKGGQRQISDAFRQMNFLRRAMPEALRGDKNSKSNLSLLIHDSDIKALQLK